MNNVWFIIPARKGSKGVPKKNRLLLKHTLEIIPESYRSNIIVSTNDEFIINEVKELYSDCRIHQRSEESASDSSSVKECIKEIIEDFSLSGPIVMLYLTYPERTWADVEAAWNWYTSKNATSMLCREEVDIHPYLCLYDVGNDRGQQMIEHNLCCRQEYPPCFKICHMVAIFNTEEVAKLNNNLYNESTVFYKIPVVLDIDTSKDLEKFLKGGKSA